MEHYLENTVNHSADTWEFWKVCAECLQISIDEFCDFMVTTNIEPLEMSWQELKTRYCDYLDEEKRLCLQIDNPMHLYGAI